MKKPYIEIFTLPNFKYTAVYDGKVLGSHKNKLGFDFKLYNEWEYTMRQKAIYEYLAPIDVGRKFYGTCATIEHDGFTTSKLSPHLIILEKPGRRPGDPKIIRYF